MAIRARNSLMCAFLLPEEEKKKPKVTAHAFGFSVPTLSSALQNL